MPRVCLCLPKMTHSFTGGVAWAVAGDDFVRAEFKDLEYKNEQSLGTYSWDMTTSSAWDMDSVSKEIPCCDIPDDISPDFLTELPNADLPTGIGETHTRRLEGDDFRRLSDAGMPIPRLATPDGFGGQGRLADAQGGGDAPKPPKS